MIRGRITRRILSASVIALAAMPAHFAGAGSNQNFPPLRTSRLVGMDIESPDGQRLGKLKDLVLDTRTGRLKYVLVSSGGFLGMGVTVRAIPPQLLSAATAKRGTLAMNVIKSRWMNAPTFNLSRPESLADPGREREIARFYRQSSGDVQLAKRSSSSAQQPLSATGKRNQERQYRDSGAEPDRPALKLASSLIKKDVFDRKHEKLGEVLDVLTDFSTETPVFVLFSAGKLFQDREHDYVAALSGFQFANGKISVEADNRILEHARPFNDRAWESAATNRAPCVFKFSEENSAASLNSAKYGWTKQRSIVADN